MTAFHPQSNSNIERMHSILKNLIKTSIAVNNNEWYDHLKFISFIINTMKNTTLGRTPFKVTFGRQPNIPSTSLIYQDLIKKWKLRHDYNITKLNERIELKKEKAKKND